MKHCDYCKRPATAHISNYHLCNEHFDRYISMFNGKA